MEFNLTFVIEYNPTDKVYRGWCEEFPDLRIENAVRKSDITEQIYRVVAQQFGNFGNAEYSISFRNKK